jgi:PKD repeat protein
MHPMKMTLRVKSALLLAGGLVMVLAGCTGKYQSDFSVIVVNRAVNAIAVLANGSEIGQVTAGQQGSFSLHLTETNPNVFTNGVAPTPESTVVLSAKDMRTGTLSQTKNVTLSQGAPVYVTFSTTDFPSVVPTRASFNTSPSNPGVNQDVFFNGSSSTVSNGTFQWDFGDGTTGSGVTTTHQYTRTGTFTVNLTVTSDNGQSNTVSRTITISAGIPATAATFTFAPTTPAVGQNVTFIASTIVPGATYIWDFGDGSIGTGTTATHAYARAATFAVTLRVTTDIGGTGATSAPRSITVSAGLAAGSASFTFSPTAPGILDDVFFNASASVVTNGSFSWDFGDGTSGTGVRPTHQYTRAGTYTVVLVVANDSGQTAAVSHTVPVSGTTTSILADFTYSPTNPLANSTVFFDGTPSSTTAISWTWDFGDGTGTTTGQKPAHSFARSGVWVVRLTVSDAQGRTGTITKSVTVCASFNATTGACVF